jgi:hypothetical protein
MAEDLLGEPAAPPAAAPAAAPPAAASPPPPPAAPPAAGAPPPALGSDPNKDFLRTLPKDLQDNPSLSRYTTPEAVARAYVQLERTLGTDKVPIPKDPSDQEAWDRYYVAGGRPPEPNGYQFQKPDKLPEGVIWDDSMEGWWRGAAFESGLSQRQAQKLVDQYRDRYIAQVDLYNKSVDTEVVSGKATLQRDWGSEYEARRAVARAAFMELPARVQQKARDSGLARDPEYIKALYEGRVRLTGETRPRPPGEAADNSPDNLRSKIASFRTQHDAALKDGNHPEHDLRLRELTDLHNRLFVDQTAA